MDVAYKFEKLITNHIGTTDYVTYATYWNDKNNRISLLFTVCLKEYDKNNTGEIGEKLEYFMEELFNDEDENKKISIDCLNFLNKLK